jgi:hypothetical protein
MIVHVAKETKDKRKLNRLATLAKQYKLHNKKEDFEKLNTLLKSAHPNVAIGRSKSIPSEDKDAFIDFLAKIVDNRSPNATHMQTLNRFLKK